MEGTPFGRYRLIELLGRGGMGEVWRAYDTTIDREVALKTLLPHFAQDNTFEQRFRREARTAARLDDPHIVPIYDVGETDGRLYVTMRLINGVDLQTLLDDAPLPPDRAVGIIEQVASALHAAHEAGLVHRDVKPSNVLLGKDDFAYLIDFGIARAVDETGFTNTGATIGTWAYMAPERFNTSEIEPSSDIYALACVLYQCLTGSLPYPGQTLQEIAAGHMFEPPPKPSTQRRTLPTAIDHVISTGLAKDPARRYPTTVELARDARNAITTAQSPAPAPDQLTERSYPAARGTPPPQAGPIQPGVSPLAPTQHRPQTDRPTATPLRSPAPAGRTAPQPAHPPTTAGNSRAVSHPAQPQARPTKPPLTPRGPTRTAQSSRRRFIGGGAAAAAALLLGPSAVWWMTHSSAPGGRRTRRARRHRTAILPAADYVFRLGRCI